ncbi:MAG TPA: transglutaminase domain-containing protein, partial [Acidimicrobiales bacterium]
MTRTGHPDRADLASGHLAAIAACTTLSFAAAGYAVTSRGALSPAIGVITGVLVSLLAVFGLPSFSVRLVARLLVLAGAVLLLRFGALTSEAFGVGMLPLVAWIAASLAALVVADRLAGDVAPPLRDPVEHRSGATTARTSVAVVITVLLVALVLAPTAERHFARSITPGNPATLGGNSAAAAPLVGSRRVDMSAQPRLSNRVVMTVDADRPSFYRGQVYDAWDGHGWTRTQDTQYRLLPGGGVQTAPSDLGAHGSDVLRQTFHVVAPYADVVYAAPSAVSVQAPVGLAQRLDGTISSPIVELRAGDSYSVVSRRVPQTVARLRAAHGPMPADVAADAQRPVATARVQALAARITKGLSGAYDRVQAIEDWMARHVEYSLDAPVAPPGRDVVDDFLFRSHLGWCEQVASSLVVLLRSEGVPARFVTGYVPEDRDPVSGSFTVRERDSHAWAEVWFPKVGWVAFDPTAHVPLAGN